MAVSDAKIYLITGLPGNGKTLHSFAVVKDLRKPPARPVFYSGIPELALDWQEMPDPTKWYECPPGSIVVIDECQRVFPPRKNGSAVPECVRQFETHRHLGIDVVLTTQHPQLLDMAVRKLTGRHIHLHRKYGREASTRYQWERCVDPNDRSVKKEALVSVLPFDKKAFENYRSAEINVGAKRDFPKKPLFVLAGSVLAVAGLIWVAAQHLRGIGKQEQTAAAVEAASADGGVMLDPVNVSGRWETDAFLPRIGQWQWSAPFYDPVAKVQSAPKITGCMEMRVGVRNICKCSNGQGDANVDPKTCRDYMAGKVYDPTRPYVDVKAENIRRLDAASSRTGESEGESGSTGTTFTQPQPSSVRAPRAGSE